MFPGVNRNCLDTLIRFWLHRHKSLPREVMPRQQSHGQPRRRGNQEPEKPKSMEMEFSRRVRIRKLQGENDGVFPTSTEKEGWEREPPAEGERYFLYQDNGRIFRTGFVHKGDDDGFETENSRYELVVIPVQQPNKSVNEEGILASTQEIRHSAPPPFPRCRPAKVKVRCADGSTVLGFVNLSCEATGFDRVSEIFTEGEKPFIVVFDAMSRGKGQRVMIINKSHVVWVSPED